MSEPAEVKLRQERVLGLNISVGSFNDHIAAILQAAQGHRSGYVCCVNAHMTVEAWKAAEFGAVVNGADLATPDGMPVLKGLHWFHHIEQERVAGNDLMPALLTEAARRGLSVYLYGSEQKLLDAIIAIAPARHPGLHIVGAESPPFRPLTNAEMASTVERINAAGAHLVMVSLGCPKQERWMAQMKGRINAMMIGLGGAFRLYAGVDTRAPKWMRDRGLEWAYRLWLEPGRLWKRYLVTNTVFAVLFAREAVLRALGKRR